MCASCYTQVEYFTFMLIKIIFNRKNRRDSRQYESQFQILYRKMFSFETVFCIGKTKRIKNHTKMKRKVLSNVFINTIMCALISIIFFFCFRFYVCCNKESTKCSIYVPLDCMNQKNVNML